MSIQSQSAHIALNIALLAGYYSFNRFNLVPRKKLSIQLSGIALSYLIHESRPCTNALSRFHKNLPDSVYIASSAALIGMTGKLAELPLKVNAISTLVFGGAQSTIYYLKNREAISPHPVPQIQPNILDKDQYVKAYETLGDGACALHALNGEVHNGKWTFNPENLSNGDFGAFAKKHFLKQLASRLELIAMGNAFSTLHFYDTAMLYLDCLHEFTNRYDLTAEENALLKDKLAEFLVHRESKLQKAKEDRRQLYLKIVEEEALEGFIFETLQSTKPTYCSWDISQLKEFFKGDSQACENAFAAEFNSILPILNQDPRFQEVMGSLFSAYEALSQKELLFLSSDNVFKVYERHVLEASYHLSDKELALAAHLYGAQVILFSETQNPLVLNEQKGPCVAIEHSGSHQTGHYSRLSLKE